MPNTKSAEKRLRQNKVRNLQNRAIRSSVRSQVKKVRLAIDQGDKEASQSEFRLAVQQLDKAAVRKIIHKNKAARTKSRLSKAIKAM